jgi:hypothetical protein
MPVEHVHPLVRTQKQLDRVLNEIEEMPGIVLYTLRCAKGSGSVAKTTGSG